MSTDPVKLRKQMNDQEYNDVISDFIEGQGNYSIKSMFTSPTYRKDPFLVKHLIGLQMAALKFLELRVAQPNGPLPKDKKLEILNTMYEHADALYRYGEPDKDEHFPNGKPGTPQFDFSSAYFVPFVYSVMTNKNGDTKQVYTLEEFEKYVDKYNYREVDPNDDYEGYSLDSPSNFYKFKEAIEYAIGELGGNVPNRKRGLDDE